jgi:hypothetical protein
MLVFHPHSDEFQIAIEQFASTPICSKIIDLKILPRRRSSGSFSEVRDTTSKQQPEL